MDPEIRPYWVNIKEMFVWCGYTSDSRVPYNRYARDYDDYPEQGQNDDVLYQTASVKR